MKKVSRTAAPRKGAPDDKLATRQPLNEERLARASAFLRKADPRLGEVIDAVGPCTMLPRHEGTHFDAIARSIVYQQLSGKAAATIYGRFVEACGTNGEAPHAAAILSHDAELLRSAGLSTAKTAAIRDLAQHVVDGRLPLDRIEHLDDDEIVEALVQVKGIGQWTAQMFLMFRLGRPDVLPLLDLGVRKGAQRIHRLRKLPEADRLEKLARPWRPWRSVASWYCWRVLEL